MNASADSRQIGDQVQSMTRGAPTPPPADGQRLFAYPSVYYPAAPSAATATVVTVASGNERTGVDLQVKPVPMVKVSGTVVGGVGTVGELPAAPASARGRRFGPHGRRRRYAHGRGRGIHLSDGAGRRLRPEGCPDPEAGRPSAPTTSSRDRQRHDGDDQSGAPTLEPPPIPAEPTLWATVPVNIGDTDVSG